MGHVGGCRVSERECLRSRKRRMHTPWRASSQAKAGDPGPCPQGRVFLRALGSSPCFGRNGQTQGAGAILDRRHPLNRILC